VESAWNRLKAFYRRQPASTTPIVLIVVAVLVGNAVYLTGLANNNPIWWTANIAHYACHANCSRPMIDPNVGFITQPIGHLAAMDLLHGHIPWWNYFQGLGQPLIGEMQSAALFPLTLLFALPSGLLWFHICLEVIAGASTFFLAKRLGLPILIATAAGVLFALNGTYSWLGNAVLNPIAFLPMLLLGIEMIYDSARSTSRQGWYVAAFALAFSLYSGFPEVAYFDGLFCLAWAIVRWFDVPAEFRLVAAKRLGIAGLVGVALALPALVPFLDFLKVANVGGHVASMEGSAHMSLKAAPLFLDPYIYGTFSMNPSAAGLFGSMGGYFTASVATLGLLGLFGARLRRLRIFLGVWVALCICGAFNILYLRHVWNLLPLVKVAAFGRYVTPSCEMALIVLAVLGVADFATSERARRLLNFTSLFVILSLAWGVFIASPLNHVIILGSKHRLAFMFLDALPFLAVVAVAVIGNVVTRRIATTLIVLVLIAESLVMFIVPTVQSPTFITVDQAPITFLQQNQGQQRFLDFSVIDANWGSQFRLNSLSAIDLPFPKAFTTLIQTQLFPGLTPTNQFIIHHGAAGIVAQQNAVIAHLAAYEAASVKYLVMPTIVPIEPGLTSLGVTKVFSDARVTIYQLPHPQPFFSATSCTVTSTTYDHARVNCPNGAGTLVRTELSMAGWTASVNGKNAPITTVDGVYQSVTVPKGSSDVAFSFTPPHVRYAILLAFAAFVFLCWSWVRERRSMLRHRRH